MIAVPLAFLAATNTTPSKLFLRPIALFCIVASRSINSLIWALLLGWFVFGDWPQTIVLAGAAIVIAAGIFVIWREHQLGLARKKAAEMASKRAI